MDWPEAHDDFRVCTSTEDRVIGTLREIATQKTVGDKPLVLVPVAIPEVDPEESAPELPRCDMLWVGRESDVSVARSVETWARVGTLVVSDKLDAANKGAAIGLLTEEGRVRFEVDRPALATAKLVASSQLLKLARKVQ